MPSGTDVGPRHIGKSQSQHDERGHLQNVCQYRAEHRHVQQNGAHGAALRREVDGQGHCETQGRPGQQGPLRCFARAVRHRKKRGEIACPRERINLPAIRKNDGVKAGDQAGAGEQRQYARLHTLPEDGLEAEKERLIGHRHFGHAGRDSGTQHHGQKRDGNQRHQAIEDAAGHIARGVVTLFGGQRQLLDSQVQPQREGQFQQGSRARMRAAREIRRGPAGQIEMRRRAHPEDRQHGQRYGRDHHRYMEGHLHAPHVQRYEDAVAQQPPGRFPCAGGAEDGAEIAADADHDDGRREDVLHVFGQAGDVTAPRAHGRACEGIRAAGVGQSGRHFRDGKTQPDVHEGHHHHGQQHAAEASSRHAEIPAEEISGDHRAHAHGPQLEHARVPAQAASGKILGVGRGIGCLHECVATSLRQRAL